MAFQKMLWLASPTPTILGSWDYWTSISKIIISDETLPNANWVTKKNNKIAYYGVFHSQNASSTTYGYMVISPDSSGAESSYRGSTVYNSGTIVDVNNITWYYTYRTNGLTFSSVPDYCLNAREEDGINQIAQDLLDRIYAVPFSSQVHDQEFNVNITEITDVRKSLRKAYGVYLFMNVARAKNNLNYITASNEAETFIDYFVNQYPQPTLPYKRIVDFEIREWSGGNSHNIVLTTMGDVQESQTADLYTMQSAFGYNYYNTSHEIDDVSKVITILQDGTYSYGGWRVPVEVCIGLSIIKDIGGMTIYESHSSNVGIDL